jgi:hypothetical protein
MDSRSANQLYNFTVYKSNIDGRAPLPLNVDVDVNVVADAVVPPRAARRETRSIYPASKLRLRSRRRT